MSKTRISATDLIWVFHEKLREVEDHAQQGIAIAIVPHGGGKWRAVTPRAVHPRSVLWAKRIDAIEAALRKRYFLEDR